MNKEIFNQEVTDLLNQAHETLVTKNNRYATDDALHNFKRGAEIGGMDPVQTCWGYMVKHLTALSDMINNKHDVVDENDLLEKCQDIINYVIFVNCLIKERNHEYVSCAKCEYEDPDKELVGYEEIG